MTLTDTYKALLERFGRQNWWPAETQFEIVVGAILTQNTNWKNVEKALNNLKKENALEAETIIDININTLEKLIRPSGFYKQKAQRLKRISEWYLQVDKTKPLKELRKELLNINGVGEETADSILLYALEKPIFVIDAYTKRFCKEQRLFEGKTYSEYQEYFHNNLEKEIKLFKEFHALIVEWGKANRKNNKQEI